MGITLLSSLIQKAKGIPLGGVTGSDGHVLSLASQIRNVSQLSEEFDRS
ncbi:hypothetical protein LC653_36950 [Nostoc sp. CHAB 5784]|uniref:Transposase n=1 Tax=Nostoc favosum CHAB5714 TaxID=2780399 RepID=A0ABS8ILV0_9NOSO|nr:MULTISPECIES: hypothetical protein [Nostoc]MCC5605021.1 hypothetical protein [Nostoc favosum CHAB5714]MCC5669282.1 hypothetical protein [Nostoc mirabile CHAB5784]